MYSQIEVYRTYLPNLKHLYIMFGILVALTLLISIPATAFGQSDDGDNAVTDQTVKIISGVNVTPSEDPPAEEPEPIPTAAAAPTTAPATETPAPASEPVVVPEINQEDVDDEPLPTTGPAETISATIGIVSFALVYSYYKNSRTLVTQAIRNS